MATLSHELDARTRLRRIDAAWGFACETLAYASMPKDTPKNTPAAPGSLPPAAAPPAHTPPTNNRFARFARLTGLGASAAARHLSQKVVGAFGSKEQAIAGEHRANLKTAVEVTRALGELKGGAMKIGQMLATDPELLPKEMVEQLSQLQHSAPPMAFETVRAVLQSTYGCPLEEVFSSFSETAIGAASIGQVHVATTTAGVRVAVKVQYPGIADTIGSDINNFGTLLNIARATVPKERVDGYLEEVRAVVMAESDYVNEANNLERFQVILKDVEGVRVPIPLHELTHKNVLVMEYFEGVRLTDWLADASSGDKTVQGQRLLNAYLEMIHVHGVLHADPHPGNFMVLTGPKHAPTSTQRVPCIGVLDLGCVRDYPIAFMDNMLQLLCDLWRHDLSALQTTWTRAGFLDLGVDPEVAYEWLSLIFAPLLNDVVTDFSSWKIQQDSMNFVMQHPSIKRLAPPREALFYLRVLVGLRALMHQTGMQLNLYQISRDICRKRGLLR